MSNQKKKNLKRPHPYFDYEFGFDDSKIARPWDFKNQKVFAKNYKVMYPSTPITKDMKYIEFDFKDTEYVWSFGPNTRFMITGRFECMTPAHGDTPATEWTGVTSDDVDKVIVSPNFLDVMIRSFKIFRNSTEIKSSCEEDFIAPYLNMWKYNYMDKDKKKRLCMEPACSGNGVPSKKNGWSFNEGSEWRTDYGPKIFLGEKPITFDWVPLDVPPFFQGDNYIDDFHREWPMPRLDRYRIQIIFHDHLDSIFQKKDGNNKMYRFVFSEFKLYVEYYRLNPLFQKQYLNSQEEIEYPGVTRLEKCLKIPENTPVFRYEFNPIPMPEGIFIFALNKNILNGTYKYVNNSEGTVFEKHNIDEIKINYDHQPLFVESPHAGQICLDQIETKIKNDYLYSPPFGMKMDIDKITPDSVSDGGVNTAFPHIFVNLCVNRDKMRIIPLDRDHTVFNEDRTFELTINFKKGGATSDVVYVVYFYYTDVNLILDPKSTFGPMFRSPYLRSI